MDSCGKKRDILKTSSVCRMLSISDLCAYVPDYGIKMLSYRNVSIGLWPVTVPERREMSFVRMTSGIVNSTFRM